MPKIFDLGATLIEFRATIRDAFLSLKRYPSTKPILDITKLCFWKRLLMLISLQVLCVVVENKQKNLFHNGIRILERNVYRNGTVDIFKNGSG